jgi:hypothetical protein
MGHLGVHRFEVRFLFFQQLIFNPKGLDLIFQLLVLYLQFS